MTVKHGDTKEERLKALKEALERSESKKVRWPTVAVKQSGKAKY